MVEITDEMVAEVTNVGGKIWHQAALRDVLAAAAPLIEAQVKKEIRELAADRKREAEAETDRQHRRELHYLVAGIKEAAALLTEGGDGD